MKRKALVLSFILVVQIILLSIPVSAAEQEAYGWDVNESIRVQALLEEQFSGKSVKEVFGYEDRFLDEIENSDFIDVSFGQAVPIFEGAQFGSYSIEDEYYEWNEGPYGEGFGSGFYTYLLNGEYEKALSCDELYLDWCVPVYAVNPSTMKRELYSFATVEEMVGETRLNEWDDKWIPDPHLTELMFDFEAMYTYIQEVGISKVDYYVYYMYMDFTSVLIVSDRNLFIIPLAVNRRLHTGYEPGKVYALDDYLVKAQIKRHIVEWEYVQAGGWGLDGGLPNDSTLVYKDGEFLNEFATYPILYYYPVVPLRAVMESVGAQVGWDGETRTAIVKYNDVEYRFELGETNFNNEGTHVWHSISEGSPNQYVTGGNTVWKNGVRLQLENPVYILNDRTMVPLSFIQEVLGNMVTYDEEPNVLVITTK